MNPRPYRSDTRVRRYPSMCHEKTIDLRSVSSPLLFAAWLGLLSPLAHGQSEHPYCDLNPGTPAHCIVRSVFSACASDFTITGVSEYKLTSTIGESIVGPFHSQFSSPFYSGIAGFWPRNTPFVLPCDADVDNGTFTGMPDEGVTIEDLLYFLECFNLGRLCADLDDGTGLGNPDGGITIEDLLYFLFRFDRGC